MTRKPLTGQREKELRKQADAKANPSNGFVGKWLRELLAELDWTRARYAELSLEVDALRRASNQHMSLQGAAYDHPGHLYNGLCPDDPGEGSPGPDSRDSACFYCNVLNLIEQLEAAQRDRDSWANVAREYETVLADRGLL